MHCCRSQPISHSLFGELSTEKYILWKERNEKGIVFILLTDELFVDVLFMMALANSSLYIPIAIAIVATLVALIWLIILFAKAEGKHV